MPLLQLKNATGIPGTIYSGLNSFAAGFSETMGHVPSIKEPFDIWGHNRDVLCSIRKMPSPKAVLADTLITRFKARAIALGEGPAQARKGKRNGHAMIDKSQLPLPEPKRMRSREHLSFVARKACLICGRSPAQVYNLRFALPRALARKASDEYAVPLRNIHHFELHRTGDDKAWWKEKKINPMNIAWNLSAERRNIKEPAPKSKLTRVPE